MPSFSRIAASNFCSSGVSLRRTATSFFFVMTFTKYN